MHLSQALLVIDGPQLTGLCAHLHILSRSGKEEDRNRPFQVRQSCMISTLLDAVCHETDRSGRLRPAPHPAGHGCRCERSAVSATRQARLALAFYSLSSMHSLHCPVFRGHIVHSSAILVGPQHPCFRMTNSGTVAVGIGSEPETSI